MTPVPSGIVPYTLLSPERPEARFSGRCALAVMAKAPVPGKVKTRLTPPLTASEAAELNACFLRDTVANLLAAAEKVPAEVVISYTPTGAEAAFNNILPPHTLLVPQRGQSFGERLLCTAEDLFSCGFSAVCLIDSDSPTVPVKEFAEATEVLLAPGSRAALGPSADGGYYLLGLQRAEENLFARIAWSTEAVYAQTVERAQEIGLDLHLLTEWYDVDDGRSLERLTVELLGGEAKGQRAHHTEAYLRTLASRTPAVTQA